MPCTLAEVYHIFRDEQASNKQPLLACSACPSSLEMEATDFSKLPVNFYYNLQCTSQKKVVFIFTTMRTSNLTKFGKFMNI
jgi:hypothetical protein